MNCVLDAEGKLFFGGIVFNADTDEVRALLSLLKYVGGLLSIHHARKPVHQRGQHSDLTQHTIKYLSSIESTISCSFPNVCSIRVCTGQTVPLRQPHAGLELELVRLSAIN